MATYRDAVRRLQIIYNECNPQSNQNKKDVDKSADEFTQLKKELHLEVKQIRLMLKDREELLAVKPGSKEAAEASHRIRSQIKQLREDAMRLQAHQKQEEKKAKSEQAQDKVKGREDIVALVFKHIEELESLEKKRYTDKLSTDRSALFAGAAPVKIEMTNFKGRPDGPMASELPDIDADPEVTNGLQALDAGNRDLDRDLDEIQAQVGILKEIAINMDQELSKQNEMLSTITKKVDKAQDHLDNVNLKLKSALDGVMKGDKFIVNCVLLTILLCLVGFISTYAMN